MAISKRGMRKIVVDNDVYYWRSHGDGYWFTGSANTVEVSIVTAAGLERGKRGRWLRFAQPRRGPYDQIGWWDDIDGTITPRHVERAIRIGRRHREPGDVVLTRDEVRELLDLELRPVAHHLQGLAARIAAWPNEHVQLVADLLSIGCRRDDMLCDDWVACHAAELERARVTLQSLVNGIPRNMTPTSYEQRSAIELLRAMCERVGFDLGLDCTAVDDELRGRTAMVLPWGIPEQHWWWTQL